MIEALITGGITGAIASGLIVWLAKAVMTERIKNSIKHEYDTKLEAHKSELKSEMDKNVEVFKAEVRANELVNTTRWKMKRDACLAALDVIDALWSNMDWTGADQKGRQVQSGAIERQDAPDIKSVRSTYSLLVLCCDNEDTLLQYQRCLKMTDDFSGDAIVDLRNAVRRELGFGNDFDFDRARAFIGRVNRQDPSKATQADASGAADL